MHLRNISYSARTIFQLSQLMQRISYQMTYTNWYLLFCQDHHSCRLLKQLSYILSWRSYRAFRDSLDIVWKYSLYMVLLCEGHHPFSLMQQSPQIQSCHQLQPLTYVYVFTHFCFVVFWLETELCLGLYQGERIETDKYRQTLWTSRITILRHAFLPSQFHQRPTQRRFPQKGHKNKKCLVLCGIWWQNMSIQRILWILRMMRENIYSSQESNKSSKRRRKEEKEFSKSCPAALTITTAAAAILRSKFKWCWGWPWPWLIW